MKNLQAILHLISILVVISSCKFDPNRNHVRSTNDALQKEIDSLNVKLSNISEETIIPGFSTTIVQGDEILYSLSLIHISEPTRPY